MRLINYIEDGKLEEAERLLGAYTIYDQNAKNKSREKIEKQFYLFMKIQILKNKNSSNSEDVIESMLEEALKLTVPNVDVQPLKKLRLSSLEITLVLEYKSRKYIKVSVEEKISIYEELLEYVENALSGTISAAKVYAKIVVYMCKDIFAALGLKLKRGNVLHACMYNVAWNNDQAKIKDYRYNEQIKRCIEISRILGDVNHERFYQNSLIAYMVLKFRYQIFPYKWKHIPVHIKIYTIRSFWLR